MGKKKKSCQWEPEFSFLGKAHKYNWKNQNWKMEIKGALPPTEVMGTSSIAVGEHTKRHHLAHFVLYLTFPNEWVTMNGLSLWLSQFWGNVQN